MLALYEIFDIIFLLILGREVCEYQVSRNGTLAEARKREFYVKPGVRRKLKSEAARKARRGK